MGVPENGGYQIRNNIDMFKNMAFLMWTWWSMSGFGDQLVDSGVPSCFKIHPNHEANEKGHQLTLLDVPRAETRESWHPNVHRPCHEWWLAMRYQIPGALNLSGKMWYINHTGLDGFLLGLGKLHCLTMFGYFLGWLPPSKEAQRGCHYSVPTAWSPRRIQSPGATLIVIWNRSLKITQCFVGNCWMKGVPPWPHDKRETST